MVALGLLPEFSEENTDMAALGLLPNELIESILALPDEIIEAILLRLPIKSVVSFKILSKSWNSMLSDVRFIGKHYQLSMDTDNLFLKYQSWNRRFSLVRLEGQQFNKSRSWRPQGWRSSCFLCTGDGLMLLDTNRFMDPNRYMLYNPLTRQHSFLRFPYHDIHVEEYNSHQWFDFRKMYGVCYDPINKDIKVVISSKDFSTVYSCKTHSWAEKQEFPYQIAAQRFDTGLSVDGAIYWICQEKYSSRKIIVYFDSKDDSLKILEKPENLNDQRLKLKAKNGRLYLCCHGEDERTVKIWVKEKGGCSWEVLVNIDNLHNVRISTTVVAMLTENEMIILLGAERYYIYNCCDKSYREIKIRNLLWSSLHSFVYSVFSPVMKRESRRKKKSSNA